ncbi:carbohydrate ABC transporter permease [Paenibacillus hamazuiensis]|uniref:carbohydrate ABC transporter permease n=1 Tax=Paenibacillus hamazuiensis TaxID=2936508 RepID=UPI00200C22B6|nr:carbohydrate ABC transporter permease [Paenibacillus hamazuiensis]
MKETNGIISALDYKNPGVKLLYWLVMLVLFGISLICLLPPLWLLASSVKNIKEFFSVPPTLIPHSFEIHKLWETWRELNFTQLYLNTAYITAGSIVFAIVFNGIMGYFLAVLKPRGSKLLFAVIMWTMLMPNTLGIVPIFQNIISFPLLGANLMNSFWPMWMMAGSSAFYVIIFKSFFEKIPPSLIEAARLDGGSKLAVFGRIVLPMSKPILATITIFTVNAAWADFFWPFMVLKKKQMWSVAVAVYNLKELVPMDIQFIALTFAIIPPAILFILFQKYIMQGFTFSGIK